MATMQGLPDVDERWTDTELAEVRLWLEREIERLRGLVALAARDFGTHVGEFTNDLGDEAVDIGALMIEVNEGSSVATVETDILHQCEHAVARIDASQYGTCESCQRPIAKARLLAIPRATRCTICPPESIF